MMQFIPVLFCLIALASLAAVLPTSRLFASPPEEKLPELSKPQLHREKTKLEKAVDQAAAMLLQGKLPPTEDGVRFALWLYGDKGDVAYLDIATKMARELVKTDPIMGTAALYWVAQAGGPTLDDAKSWERAAYSVYAENPSKNDPNMGIDLIELIGPAAKREPLPYGRPVAFIDLDEVSSHKKSLTELVSRLRMRNERAQAVAEAIDGWEPKDWGLFMKEIAYKFWDSKNNRFIDTSAPSKFVRRDNARTALVLWEAGHVFGDSLSRQMGQKALESNLETALQDSNAVAIAALAAARMSKHPVQIAIIGSPNRQPEPPKPSALHFRDDFPGDPTITALREAAYSLFEPNKIILNLDPKTDSKRMAELMYPPDAAPAMFVCVETLCSPPIKDPAELEKQVAEIKKLAAQVEQ
jgi:hypothetical protein